MTAAKLRTTTAPPPHRVRMSPESSHNSKLHNNHANLQQLDAAIYSTRETLPPKDASRQHSTRSREPLSLSLSRLSTTYHQKGHQNGNTSQQGRKDSNTKTLETGQLPLSSHKTPHVTYTQDAPATRATNRRRKSRQGRTLRRHKFLSNRTQHGARSLTRQATTRKPHDDSRQQHGTTQSATASGEDAQRHSTANRSEWRTADQHRESGKQKAERTEWRRQRIIQAIRNEKARPGSRSNGTDGENRRGGGTETCRARTDRSSSSKAGQRTRRGRGERERERDEGWK